MKSAGPFRSVSFWIFLAVLGITLLSVFWMPLTSGQPIFAGDAVPVYPKDFHAKLYESFWGRWEEAMLGIGFGGAAFCPQYVLGMLLPPRVYGYADYMIDVVLLCFAVVYYMRGWRVRGLPGLTAGLAMAFSGYAFTLISAGHRGQFHMMPYAVLLFAFIDRAMSRREFFYFAAAGTCLGYGLVGQPDVMFMFSTAAAAYAALRFVQEWPRSRPGVYLARIGAGGVLTVLLAGMVSLAMFGNLFKTILPKREEWRGKTPEQQWEFATNWSMPPEEILELVAPCVYGIETGDVRGPYWGRLGRSMHWDTTKNGFMNFRQHTVYLGVLQLLFAAFAVGMALKKSPTVRAGPGDDTDAASSGEPSPAVAETGHPAMRGQRGVVLFWAAVFVVYLLLSLGRHFGAFYRLVYALPYCAKIRCPVKFLHVCELAVCVLFGFGLQSLWKCTKAAVAPDPKGAPVAARPGKGTVTWFMGAALLLAVALFVGAGLAGAFAPAMRTHWTGLGLGSQADLLIGMMKDALVRAGVLFLVGAGAFAIARFRPRGRHMAVTLQVVILAVVALDMGEVGKTYVRTRDASYFFFDNPLVERMQSTGKPGRLSYHLSVRARSHPLWGNLMHHGVDFLEPGRERMVTPDYREFFAAFARYPVRLWQLTSTRYVVGPRTMLDRFAESPAFEVLARFGVNNWRIELADNHPDAPLLLLHFRGALPRALVYHDWEVMPEDAALQRMASPQWEPTASVIVSGDLAPGTGKGISPVRIVRYTRPRIEMEVDLPSEGILLLNDKYDPDWRIRVDGEDTPVLRCNNIMRGLHVPAGKHRIVMTYRPYMIPFLVNLAAALAILAWGIVRLLRTRGARPSSTE